MQQWIHTLVSITKIKQGDETMKELMQVMVVILIAIPFIYMAYDVTMDLLKKFYNVSAISVNRAKPVLVSMMTSLFK